MRLCAILRDVHVVHVQCATGFPRHEIEVVVESNASYRRHIPLPPVHIVHAYVKTWTSATMCNAFQLTKRGTRGSRVYR